MKTTTKLMIAGLAALAMVACQKEKVDNKSFDQYVAEDIANVKADYPVGTEMEIWSIRAEFDKNIKDASAKIVKSYIKIGVGPYAEPGSKTVLVTRDFITGKVSKEVVPIPVTELSPIAYGYPCSMADALYHFRDKNGKDVHGEKFNLPDSKVITISLPLSLAEEGRVHPYYIVTNDGRNLYAIDATDGYPYIFKDVESEID